MAVGAVAVVAIVAAILVFRISQPAHKPVIAVVMPSSENQFWVDVARGAQEGRLSVQDYEVVIESSGDQDAKGQVGILTNFLNQGNVAALVLGPASDHEPVPIIKQFNDKGIPVVLIDTKLNAVDAGKYGAQSDAFIGSNNRDGGEKAAQQMYDTFKARGVAPAQMKVLLLEGDRVHQSAIDRSESFQQRAKTLGMTVLVRPAQWKRDQAQAAVAGAFARDPAEAKGIFASNDDMAMGAVAALEGLRIPQASWPVIIGFDATRDALAAVEQGKMCGSIKQDSKELGKAGVETAVQILTKDPGLNTNRLLTVSIVPPGVKC